MRYVLSNIKLNTNEDISILKSKVEKKLKCNISDLIIKKESIDARDKSKIQKIYTVSFSTNKKLDLSIEKNDNYELPKGDFELEKRPIIVGFGPSGMFSGLTLSRLGLKPIILERGLDVDRRKEKVKEFWETGKLDLNTNVQFGEGGAGTFSDGKLTTGIKDPRINFVLNEFVKHGAPSEILYKAKPHIGTDILSNVVKNIREEIISLGGDVIFGALVNDIIVSNEKITGVKYIKDDKEYILESNDIIFSIGHSSRDTFRMFKDRNVYMEQKPFSMGLRIEHDQDLIDKSQYGKVSRELNLEVSSYKLNYETKQGRGVYTFCMCPGGTVINASSFKDMVCINGMSEFKRDSGKANSALLCDVRVSDFESDDPLAGVYLQEKYEHLAFLNGGGNYKIPKSSVSDFMNGKAVNIYNSIPNYVKDSIIEALPYFGKKIKGFDNNDAILYAIESRSSSPVRIKRDEKYMSNIKGLYPTGEGAGYAGGIMSAAVDGVKVALSLANRGE